MEQEFSVSHVAFAYMRCQNPGYIFQQESRNYHGLVFVLSGELTMTSDTETVCIGSGGILLQWQGETYRLEITSSQPSEYIVISYLAEPLDTIRSLLPQRSFSPSHLHRYADRFSFAVRLANAYRICTQTRLRANVQDILCCIIEDYYQHCLFAKESFAEMAMDFMENNFAAPISSQDISDHVGISTSHLRLLFKKQFGLSLMHCLNQIRIRRAKELLSSGMFRVAEVANLCGFQNEYYFSRVFKQFTGTTPGKY